MKEKSMKRVMMILASVLMLSGCASYPRLSVMSLGADAVPVAVSPSDVLFRTDSTTFFQRIYPKDTVVTLTVSPVEGKWFNGWSDGSDSLIKTPAVSFTMASDKDMTVSYIDPPTPPVPPTPVFVPGNAGKDGKLQSDSETYCFINSMGVRILANDGAKIQCINGYYWIKTSLVNQMSAFSYVRLADNSVIVTGRDFTSPLSGLRYQFVGWTEHSSLNPLVTTNPLTIPASEISKTLRGYWRTVAN